MRLIIINLFFLLIVVFFKSSFSIISFGSDLSESTLESSKVNDYNLTADLLDQNSTKSVIQNEKKKSKSLLDKFLSLFKRSKKINKKDANNTAEISDDSDFNKNKTLEKSNLEEELSVEDSELQPGDWSSMKNNYDETKSENSKDLQDQEYTLKSSDDKERDEYQENNDEKRSMDYLSFYDSEYTSNNGRGESIVPKNGDFKNYIKDESTGIIRPNLDDFGLSSFEGSKKPDFSASESSFRNNFGSVEENNEYNKGSSRDTYEEYSYSKPEEKSEDSEKTKVFDSSLEDIIRPEMESLQFVSGNLTELEDTPKSQKNNYDSSNEVTMEDLEGSILDYRNNYANLSDKSVSDKYEKSLREESENNDKINDMNSNKVETINLEKSPESGIFSEIETKYPILNENEPRSEELENIMDKSEFRVLLSPEESSTRNQEKSGNKDHFEVSEKIDRSEKQNSEEQEESKTLEPEKSLMSEMSRNLDNEELEKLEMSQKERSELSEHEESEKSESQVSEESKVNEETVVPEKSKGFASRIAEAFSNFANKFRFGNKDKSKVQEASKLDESEKLDLDEQNLPKEPSLEILKSNSNEETTNIDNSEENLQNNENSSYSNYDLQNPYSTRESRSKFSENVENVSVENLDSELGSLNSEESKSSPDIDKSVASIKERSYLKENTEPKEITPIEENNRSRVKELIKLFEEDGINFGPKNIPVNNIYPYQETPGKKNVDQLINLFESEDKPENEVQPIHHLQNVPENQVNTYQPFSDTNYASDSDSELSDMEDPIQNKLYDDSHITKSTINPTYSELPEISKRQLIGLNSNFEQNQDKVLESLNQAFDLGNKLCSTGYNLLHPVSEIPNNKLIPTPTEDQKEKLMDFGNKAISNEIFELISSKVSEGHEI